MRGSMEDNLPFRMKVLLVTTVAVAAVAVVVMLPRFPQPLSYHDFADRRTLLGIPNTMDVVSNAGLAAAGVLGLVFLARRRPAGPGAPFLERWERTAFAVLFAAVGLTSLGSACYHLKPNNETLLWDRLPMAVVFMSLLSLIIGERIGMRAGRTLFLPLVAAGVASVLYWRYTEAIGKGDVRFYGLVQYLPALLIPIILLLFPPRYTRSADLVVALSWYIVAKACEIFDARVFDATKLVSGHTLKHMAAALAALWLLRMVSLRRPLASPAQA